MQFDGGTCETQRWIRCSTCINIHVHKKSCVFGGDLVGWIIGWMHLQREETPYDREGRIISVEQFIAMNNKHMQ